MKREVIKQLKASDYVHLHNHTQYSLLDGLTKVPALISAVKEMDMRVDDREIVDAGAEFLRALRAACGGDLFRRNGCALSKSARRGARDHPSQWAQLLFRRGLFQASQVLPRGIRLLRSYPGSFAAPHRTPGRTRHSLDELVYQ